MALIPVSGAALIGLVLLFEVNFVDSALSCNKCTSAEKGESCGIELDDAVHCIPEGNYRYCLTYQYTLNDSTVTVRDCTGENYNCTTLYADGKNESLLMCNECNDDSYCNKNIDTTNNTCVKCNSSDSQDCGDIIEDVGENTCFLDSTVNTECVVYKYKEDSSTVTVRDCGRKNTCETLRSGEYNDTLEMCDECSNNNGNNNCNQNIPVSKTCVKCNSLEQPGCESATINTTAITGTCFLDDTIDTECITYKYKENATTIVTVRDCASKDTCNSYLNDTYKETLVMCYGCSSDTPNCNQNLDELSTCVECNSLQDTNCNQSTIDTSTTGVCYLDNIVNFECITYKYLENSSIVSVRGCAQDKHCATLYSDTYKDDLLMCDECSDDSNCNQEFDTTKTCIECSSLNDKDCHESSTDLSTTCFLDQTVKIECITYKFNNENNETVTIKGCAPTNQCSNLLSSENSSLLMCDACKNSENNNNCNQEIDTTKTCIECNSEDDPNCDNFKIDPSITNATCYLDQTVNAECVMYKYQKDSETLVVRGCAPNCTTLDSKNELLYCYQCSDTANCNENFETSRNCVQCNSIDDPNCTEGPVDLTKVNGSCYLDDTVNVECISYKYLQDGQTYVYRGCGSEKFCDHPWSNTTVCTHCNDDDLDMCNIETNFKEEKTLCIQCTSEDDDECGKDDMNSSKIKKYCPLDDNSECVGYKYLNILSGKIQTNRDCAPNDYCKVLNDYANTTVCQEGTDLISNKKIDTSTEATLCVKCSDGEGSSCAAEEVDLSQVELCKITDTNQNGCSAFKYLNNSTGKMITERGCEAVDYCKQKSDEYTAMCTKCQGEICNQKINMTSEKAFCVKCDGEEGTECGNEKIADLSQVGFCGLDGNADLKCVAHRYLNAATGKINTHRGCNSKTYCEQFDNTTIACTTCEETDQYCNKDIKENEEKTLCVQCDSDADSECSKDTVVLAEVDFCGIASTAALQCVTYRYLNVTTNKISTHRGCETEDYCAQYNTNDTTILCEECKGNNCNKANDPTNVTLCVQCNSENESECTQDTTDLTSVGFCKTDSTNGKCVAYRYLDVESGKINTYRGCVFENYCKQQNDSTKTFCSECNNGNNCNMNIETDKEKTLCVSCDGETCASNSVDLTKVGFCGVDSSDTNRCATYRYLNVTSGKINTHRGCESENYCANNTNSDTTLLCNECAGNLCNNNVIDNDDTLCVKCSGDEGSECAADTITDLSQVDFCKINSSDKHQCVAYRYLNVTSGKISTYRGCELDNYCANQSDKSQIAMICSTCTNTDDNVCNLKIDTSIEQTNCIQCTGEEGTDCANNTISDLTKFQVCTLADNQKCVTYKYLNDKTNKINIKRGCEDANYCDNKNENYTLICDECQDEFCNINTGNEGKFICVQCTGEEESGCSNNTVDLTEVDSCIINTANNEQCVSRKYLDVSTGKINTYRGCEAKDYCKYQKRVDNGTTALCQECNDTDHCNMNVDTSEQLTLCVECVGEEGSDCGGVTVDLSNTSFCGISKKPGKNCIGYRYLEESTNRLKTVRNCEERNCSNLTVDDGKVLQCFACRQDICNNFIEIITTTTLPPTTTSGAASIVQYKFNVFFLYLIIGLLFLVH